MPVFAYIDAMDELNNDKEGVSIMYKCLVTFLVLAFCSSSLSAATLPGSIGRQSLLHSDSLAKFSIGCDYENIHRRIQPVNTSAEREIEANAYCTYMGYDVLPWFTIFTTTGATEAKVENMTEFDEMEAKWSAGLSLYLWNFDVVYPKFIAGRLSLRSMVEYAAYEAEMKNDDLSWNDASAALSFGYELFENTLNMDPDSLVSVKFWAGPVVSLIDGTYDIGGTKTDFDETRTIGVAGGVDLYLAPNLSLNGHAEMFDELTLTGGLRYHF